MLINIIHSTVFIAVVVSKKRAIARRINVHVRRMQRMFAVPWRGLW